MSRESKEIYISSTPHETRLAIVEKDELAEIYYERENEYTLAGSIYNGKVTRVLPGMQSAFVDVGLERDAFLYITDFMEEQGESADFEAEGTRSNGRGEGRRDRSEGRPRGDGRDRNEGRRRDQSPRAEAPAAEQEETVSLEGQAEPADSAEETGEGSRRWRGRRGRRRGRGPNGDAADGSHAEPGVEAADTDAGDVDRAPEPSSDRNSERSSERPRRERGRGREDAVRQRFAPRHHRPGDESIDVNASASPSAEPFILPGESLSKYRRGEAAEHRAQETSAAKSQTAVVSARPSSEFELTGAWDGGFTLPGETLSRHRGSEQRSETVASEPRSSSDASSPRGSDRRRERDQRSGRFGRERERLSPEEAVLPAVTSQHEPEPARQPFSDDVPAFEVAETEARLDLEHYAAEDIAYTPETDIAPAGVEAPAPVVLEAVEEFHETVAEYEPGEEASASYRITPTGQSEFRQSGTVDEAIEPVDAEAVTEARFDETHGFTQESDTHEFTNVQPTGEMISEWPLTPETAADDSQST
ncbi:MAG TPA: ribonuclease, partial [Acidobacteriaceae bacterium]